MLLRLTLDLMVAAGISKTTMDAKAYVDAKLREYAAAEPAIAAAALRSAAPADGVCPSCPFRDPGRLAALDGLAGVFMQAGEHFELLAEPPRARIGQ